MDIEANRVLLPPERFQTGVLRRWQLFLFIVYNILVFAVVCFTFWCFNERLSQNEKYVAVLLEKRDAPNDHDSIGRSHPMDATHAVGRHVQNVNADVINVIEKARIKRNADGKKKRKAGKSNKRKKCKVDKTGVRNERTVSSSTPHFYLRGHERTTYNEGRRATDNGIFMWKMPPSFGQSSFFSASGRNNADGSFTKVQIHQSGMYFVFAKVTANGRTQMSSADPPPVGIVLKRESSGQGPDELDISWVTQDDRGQDYGTFTRNSQEAKFPMDTISVAGLYRLDVNDKIYIQVPDDSIYRRNERFLGEGLKSHFGAFLVEACSSC